MATETKHRLTDDHKNASADIWRFMAKHYGNSNETDEWWDAMLKEADALYEKYADTDVKKYAKDYIVACVNEITREYKENRNDRP